MKLKSGQGYQYPTETNGTNHTGPFRGENGGAGGVYIPDPDRGGGGREQGPGGISAHTAGAIAARDSAPRTGGRAQGPDGLSTYVWSNQPISATMNPGSSFHMNTTDKFGNVVPNVPMGWKESEQRRVGDLRRTAANASMEAWFMANPGFEPVGGTEVVAKWFNARKQADPVGTRGTDTPLIHEYALRVKSTDLLGGEGMLLPTQPNGGAGSQHDCALVDKPFWDAMINRSFVDRGSTQLPEKFSVARPQQEAIRLTDGRPAQLFAGETYLVLSGSTVERWLAKDLQAAGVLPAPGTAQQLRQTDPGKPYADGPVVKFTVPAHPALVPQK